MISLHVSKNSLVTLVLLFFFLPEIPSIGGEIRKKEMDRSAIQVPILLYHRFGLAVSDTMTVTTSTLESQLKHLKENGYTFIPLRHLVDHCLGKRQILPYRSVVITADDGHKSVYTDMFPLLKKYRIPATLFLYPSAISNAPYAMTWDQLRKMKAEGMVDFQSHTYWHPNFKKEKKRLSPVDYEKFIDMQFKSSKEKLEKKLHIKVDMLAWPFGIYDNHLIYKAAETGYVAAFGMEQHHANSSDNVMALPRYLITNRVREKAFGRILAGSPCS